MYSPLTILLFIVWIVIHIGFIPPNPISMGLTIGVVTYYITYAYYTHQINHND